MTTRYVLDTNVLVYALDRSETEKRERPIMDIDRVYTSCTTIRGHGVAL